MIWFIALLILALIGVWFYYTLTLIRSRNLLIDRLAVPHNYMGSRYLEDLVDTLESDNVKLEASNNHLEKENAFLRDRVDSQRREISNLLTPYKTNLSQSN